MNKLRGIWCAWLLAAIAPLHAAESQVPLVWDSPACAYDKLGWVEIETGTRVSENTRDTAVPVVDYARAMDKLSAAGQARGANAVVVRWHQGLYFTRNGKQSRKPVYVKLRGAAIRMTAPERCALRFVDAGELEARSRGQQVNVSSNEAYAGE